MTAHAGGVRGTLGFSVEVEGDGSFWKPVLLSARVTKVNPGSAAEAGGLQVSDEILEVQGKKISGANAREIAALLELRPGQSLRLQVRKVGGTEQSLVLVAGVAREGKN
jgi:C-terminal processing protease CtpA/Prc